MSAPSAPEECEEQQDHFLDFSLLGDFLDYEEPKKETNQQASKNDIQSLIKFIGGFEYWNQLNEDCRQEVVKHLDYTERNRLGICSKRDYETVKTTPMDVHSVEICGTERHHWEFSQEEFDHVTVQVTFHHDYNSGKRFQLVFSQLGDDTQVRWTHYAPRKRPENRSVIWESCNYYEEAVKFAERWMKKCNFDLKHLKVEMGKYPIESSSIKSLPKCESIRIGSDDVEMFRWWLQKVPEQMKDIQLVPLEADREAFTLPADLLSAPQIMRTPKFYFWCRAAFSDEQFLALKATRMSFDCVITDETINQFIKNWVARGVFDFKQALLWAPRERNLAELTRELEVVPWDEEFVKEARGFCFDYERCCGRGQTVQISNRVDPYESLTLCVSDDRVSIYATGHKRTWGGRTDTDYSIP